MQALGPYQFGSRLLTLTGHSALDAVGFLARISVGLAAQSTACNELPAFHHDHLLERGDKLDDAQQALGNLADPASTGPAAPRGLLPTRIRRRLISWDGARPTGHTGPP